ncbi:hypothetical protein [Algibacter sp.]|uniref:hypothetical protein n=1 Tax=Algibacter sp. TaxID=1872428 RepID=UPI003C7929B0
MKNLIYICLIIFLFIGCKQKHETKTPEIYVSAAQKIANAHGFENWKNVSEIQFTFFGKRDWIWKPKTKDITLITEKDTISYNRNAMDSLALKADRAFINDKFWLLIPFQLVWDKGTTISEPTREIAPISKIQLNKIIISYNNEGGYTPGDAYDIYFDDNYLIKEWAYRKGNSPESQLINTFENYQDFNGIKIALDHKNAEGDWNLNFNNVKIK